MAWSISTYAGTRATGSPSAYRTAMFELCRAVNERQVAMGSGVLTQFKKTSGSTTPAPTMADLLNLPCTGINNFAYLNLVSIQDAIEAMADSGRFYEDDTFAVPWTLASLESAIGTSLASDPAKVNEARFWQAQKDALDRLIYMDRTTLDAHATGSYPVQQRGVINFTSLQDAWDHMLGQGPTSGTGISLVQTQTGGGYIHSISTKQQNLPDSTGFVGDALAANYIVNIRTTNVSYFTGSMSVSIDSTSDSYSATTPANILREVPANLADLNFGGISNVISQWTNVPGTVPFSGPPIASGFFFQVRVSYDPRAIKFFVDLTPVLTDQS